jgi:cation transporter-like permease
MPFGVAAIIFAAQASGAVSSGNYEKAESLAGQAKNYVTIAVIIGLLINVIGFIFGFVGAVSQ